MTLAQPTKAQALSLQTIIIIIILIVAAVAIISIFRTGTSGGFAPIQGMIGRSDTSADNVLKDDEGAENLPNSWFDNMFCKKNADGNCIEE